MAYCQTVNYDIFDILSVREDVHQVRIGANFHIISVSGANLVLAV